MSKYVVTGGGGFLGKAIGRRLVSMGHQVISLARGNYPELRDLGIVHRRIDLSQDSSSLEEIVRGADAVFHVAAKVDMWGKFEDFFLANVVATRNILEACKNNKIGKLIFTSSPSVVADGRDLLGIDETYPYPRSYSAYYPQTKAQAEQEVLRANCAELKTIALRPHLIHGPGDTNLVPTILEKARLGKLMKVGSGENLSDFTYIDDCVNAHILALDALDKNKNCSGRAFFISQGQPVKMWDWIDQVLLRNGLPKVNKKIPYKVAKTLAILLEGVSKCLPSRPEPLLTKFLVCEMATSHYFSIEAARKELNYQPCLTIEQALDCTFASQENEGKRNVCG